MAKSFSRLALAAAGLATLITSAIAGPPAIAAGPDSTNCVTDSYCTAVFSTVTSTGSWTVPVNVNDLDVLVVGGGGGGTRGRCGYSWGPGGGGGGVAQVSDTIVTPGNTVSVSVGGGGTRSGECSTTTQGTAGGFSKVEITADSLSVQANGGTSPLNGTAMTSSPGGVSGSTVVNGVTTAGKAGGTVTFDTSGCPNNCPAGGGGGAGAAGSGLNAGTGVLSSLTNTRFGGGGGGRTSNTYGTSDTNAGYAPNNCDAQANSGAGGSDCGSRAGDGGSGYVYIRYLAGPTSTISANQSIGIGQSASFTVTATKATNLTTASFAYQWQKSTNSGTSWSNISGATAATYSTGAQANDSNNGAQYRAKITQTGTTGSVAPTSFSYSAASTLSITQQAQTITFNSLANRTFGDADFTLTGTASSSLDVAYTSATTSVCSVSTSTVSILSAGTCTINANQAGNSTYLAATQVQRSFTVAKSPVSIASVSTQSVGYAPGATFTLTPPTVSSTAVAGTIAGSWGYTSSNTAVAQYSSGDTFDIVGSGSSTITATFTPTNQNLDASSITFTLSATQGANTITFAGLSDRNVSASSFAVSPSASSGLAVTVTSATTSVCTVSSNTVTIVASGTCSLKANQAGNSNYSAATEVSVGFTVNPITVTYNSNFGTATTATQSITSASATTLTTNSFNRTGYTFAGWNTAANGTGTSYANQASASMTTDTTLYAQWSAVNYSITYNSASHTSGAVPTDSTNYNIGNSIAILGNSGNLARTGYTFAGWTVASDGSGTVLVSGSTLTMGSASVTVYAKWSANTYTISYDANGATGTQTNASESYTTGNAGVTLSTRGTLAKAGHTFNGWATSPSGTPISGAFTTSSNVTLYAQWAINTISITYDKGSASSSSFTIFPGTAQTGNYGTRVNLNATLDRSVTIGVSDIYQFVGWSDGTTTYAAGASYLLDSDVTMTAIWVQVFAVRYSFNGGTAAANTSSIALECVVAGNRCTDQQVITLHAAPSRAGYNFAGWRDQSSADFSAGASFTVTSTSYLLYAQWSPVSYTITYAANGGSTTNTQVNQNIGDRFAVGAAANRTGYDFAGWSDGSATYAAGATYVVGSSNITLTAQWTPHVYAVTFDWNGGSGSALNAVNYTVGTTGLTLPGITDQVKDGYTFGGWSTSVGGLALSSPFVPTAATNLFAIWGSGSYVITYAPELGTVSTTTVTVANGSSINLESPSRQGFVFDGWFTAQTGGTRVGGANAQFTPASSRTLHARWTQASIYGIPVGNLSRLGSANASSSSNATFIGSNANSSVSVTVPSGALPSGTSVNVDLISDSSHASGLINGDKTFILSVAVSWLASDGTVPDTASGKAISVTLNNPDIKAGAAIYSVQGVTAVLLGTATQDGTVTFQLTQDPGIYVVATSPTAPLSPSASTSSQGATISWQAPSSDGGDVIIGYTVTLNTGATCTTTGALSCSISSLTAGTTYTYTVTANNSVGTSPTASGSFTIAANHTITFDANGAPGSMSNQVSNVSATIAPNTFARTGYAFAGWNTAANGSGTAIADGASYAFAADVTLYAQWSASTYTVTYNYNSATTQNGPSSSGFTSGNAAITLPTPTKVGYSFDGWFTDAGLTTLLGAGGYAYSPTTSPTLYAGWTVLPNRTVTFDANTGSGTMTNQVTNVATALTTNTFTKSGYTFAGWNTAADGSGTSYADGASYAFAAGATLYAQWTLIPVAPPTPVQPSPQYERPDAPSNVSASATNGDSITVSWTAPIFNGGTAIINYRVSSSSGMACITAETSCTFNGVNKDVSYTFSVTSNNGYRVSNPSVTSNAVLIPSQLINQAPLSVAGSQSTRGQSVQLVVVGGSTGAEIIYNVVDGTAKGCSIDGSGVLTATASGTCLVTVTRLGDFTYKPVSSASTAITFLCALIAQQPLSLGSTGTTSVQLSTTGGSGSGAVTFAVADATGSCVLTGSVLTASKSGTCLVTATKASDDVYLAATTNQVAVSVQAKPAERPDDSPTVIKVPPVQHVVAVKPTGAPVLKGTLVVKPITFNPDSAKLDAGDLKQLKAAATFAKANKISVLVTGFVKSAGRGSVFEKLLATSRARAVATYLSKLGVRVSIAYAGYGAYNAKAPSVTDRRVEIRWVSSN